MHPIVGIDLGTTNSLVAFVQAGLPAVLPDEAGRPLVPSVVSLPEGGQPLVGFEALALAEENARRSVYSVKRLMGRGLADIAPIRHLLPFDFQASSAEMVRLTLGEKAYTPIALSGMILGRLRAIAERRLECPVDRAVVTVPAYFNDAQRQATIAAARLAGLEVARLVNEPTAACLAYGLHERREGLVAVYDLGGGTFDVSILRLSGGVFEVVATHGDTELGGDDLDRGLMAIVAEQVRDAAGVDLLAAPETAMQLRAAVKAAKQELSEAEAATMAIRLPDGRRLELGLARGDLEAIARPILERTLAPCRQAMADAGVTAAEVDEVVLVGGATRMPLVKAMVAELFGRAPFDRLDPDQVVALGAAVQAEILMGARQDMLLVDVVPLSLGLETMGGAVERLIPRNSPIPTSAKESFTTFVDHQTAIDLHVVQGERELAADNRSLARFRLPIAPQPAGMPRLEVKFAIDASGVLTVTATDTRAQTAQTLTVQPTFGLAESDVARMVADSAAHAEDDAAAGALVAIRNKGEALAQATEKALAAPATAGLDPDVRAMIEGSLGQLRLAMAGGDALFIRACFEQLDHMTEDLAGLIMGDALNQALTGERG